ncbi:lysis system o-spanin lipoprotein Rz1 [Proteus mirabilis]
MLLTLVLSGCTSKQSVQQSPRIQPKAEAMKPPHDLTKQLNKIIYVSEK